jgi:hypothetical protein
MRRLSGTKRAAMAKVEATTARVLCCPVRAKNTALKHHYAA